LIHWIDLEGIKLICLSFNVNRIYLFVLILVSNEIVLDLIDIEKFDFELVLIYYVEWFVSNDINGIEFHLKLIY
jgi:hypothetical protein